MKRILLILSAIFITNTVFSQIPTASLLSWYPFCADTLDHSGNGHDLIENSLGFTPPVLTTDRFGNPNDAFLFNGLGSLLRYNTFFSAAGDLSYSCWINPASRQSSTIVYEGHLTVPQNGFGLVMNNGTIGSPGDSVSIMFGGIGQYLSTPVTLNQWHHLVFTRSGNSYEFYVDTVLIGSFVDVFYPLGSPDVFNVGHDYASGTNAFNGKIDDIAVYSRRLLSTEVRALYHFNPDVVPFTLGNDTAICTNSITLAPSDNTTGGQYTWGTGTTTISTGTTVVVNPPNFPGLLYWLTITKQYGCTISDSIKVRHITPHVFLGNDTAFCDGFTRILNSPLVRVAGESYLWSTGDTTGTLPVSTAGTYWLTLDSMGCFGSDTISVAIKPHLAVNLGPDTSSCNGAPVTVQSSVVYSPSVTYVWGALPILAAPVTTPTFVATVTGVYWVTVTDTNGCPWADTVRVQIVYDTFHFNMHDTALCQGASLFVNVTVNPNISYQWIPSTGMVNSNVANPTITTSVSATYVMTASYAGCKDSVDSFHLDIQPNPVVGFFGPPRSVCIGDTIHIGSVVFPSGYGGYIYNWSPGTNLDDPTASTVVFTAGDTTNLILTVSTSHGCTGKDSVQVNVHPSQFLGLDTTQRIICPGDSVRFFPYILPIPEITTVTYAWTPSIYVSDPTAQSPWIHPITNQNYMVVGTSQFGCHDTVFGNVIVYPAAVLYMEDSTVIYTGESYVIAPQTNCTNFLWSPDIGLNNPHISDPTASPDVNTIYTVHASTEHGCTVTDSIRIRVSPFANIAIPNAFTPGAGINNYLKVMKNGLASLNYFRVFDRWGVLVYSSQDIDAGWDGSYKGKPQPFGVYVYEIEAVTNLGKIYRKQGNVTLIR